jgi:hypothetical protein
MSTFGGYSGHPWESISVMEKVPFEIPLLIFWMNLMIFSVVYYSPSWIHSFSKVGFFNIF